MVALLTVGASGGETGGVIKAEKPNASAGESAPECKRIASAPAPPVMPAETEPEPEPAPELELELELEAVTAGAAESTGEPVPGAHAGCITA